MRAAFIIAPLLLIAGCAAPRPPAHTQAHQNVARYNLWLADEAPDSYGYRITSGTPPGLRALIVQSLGAAGMYEDPEYATLELSASLHVGVPRMTEVSPHSTAWLDAREDRKFVELTDFAGRIAMVSASHPEAYRAVRYVIRFTRSNLVIQAARVGKPVWCAEITVLTTEDRPEQVARLLQPAVIEVLARTSASTVPRNQALAQTGTELIPEKGVVASAEVGETR